MKKNSLIFIIIFCLLFTACPSGFLEADTLTLTLEKNEYAVNEDIEFNVGGKYSAEDKAKFLCIYFYIEEYDGKSDPARYKGVTVKSINNAALEDAGSNKLILESVPYANMKGGYIYFEQFLGDVFEYCYLQKNPYITDLNESVVFSLQDPGDYRLVVQVQLESDKYRYGTDEFMVYRFTVTE